ncbi:MAG: hypothetical protein V3V08_15940 [Nannocystaceae bacterium]
MITPPNNTTPDPATEIRDERDYRAVQAALSRRSEPPWVMQFLINLFERYRQARKIGWSRPWNKHGTVIFESFRLDPRRDADLLAYAHKVLTFLRAPMPATALELVDELAAAGADLMAFVFLAHVQEGPRRFERVTFGLGRRSSIAPRCRDRVDIDLDSEIHGDRSDGVSRVRVFVDPYRAKPRGLVWCHETERVPAAARSLFERTRVLARDWSDNDRRWTHWTSDYLNYFGPRRWALATTQLPPADAAPPERPAGLTASKPTLPAG